MKRILGEPLVHFLLLGAAMFIGFSVVSKHAGDAPETIVVTQGRIAHLVTGFSRTWQRLPTTQELDGLVRAYIREELYYREAVKVGLDRDDTVVRRRLQQKLEFLSEDVAAMAEPTEAELQAFLRAYPDTFRGESRFTFWHIYLNPDRHRETLAADAAKLLVGLNQAGAKLDPATLGDPFLLERELDSVRGSDVVKLFGEKFAATLRELTPGRWQGPVDSGYGVHLVWIQERTPGRVPPLADVRDAVRREWANVRRLEANENFFQGLLKRYTVHIEPAPTAAGGGAAGGTTR